MIRGVKLTYPPAIAAGAGVILAIAAIVWKTTSIDSLQQNIRYEAAQLQANRKMADDLSAFSDERITAARKAADEFRGRIVTDAAWDKFVKDVAGEEWSPRSDLIADGKGKLEDYLLKRVTFTLLSNSISDWSKVMRFLEAVEQRRADFGVSRVDIRTSGDREARKFESVQVEIVFFAKRTS